MTFKRRTLVTFVGIMTVSLPHHVHKRHSFQPPLAWIKRKMVMTFVRRTVVSLPQHIRKRHSFHPALARFPAQQRHSSCKCGMHTNTLVQARILLYFELICPPVDSFFLPKKAHAHE